MPFPNSKAYLNRHVILLFIAFGIVLMVMSSGAILSLHSIGMLNQRVENLAKVNNAKLFLLTNLGNIVRERLQILYHIMQVNDPFEAAEMREDLYQLGSKFIQTRERLLRLGLSEREQQLLEEQRPLLRDSREIVEQIFTLAQRGNFEQALPLVRSARERIGQVLEKLRAVHMARLDAALEMQLAHQDSTEIRNHILILNSIAMLGCLSILFYVGYKISQQSRALAESALQLEESNKSLEVRVLERTRELIEARDQALEGSRTKSRFLANMSHELRTPLNAIIGYGEILKEESEDLGHNYALGELEKILDSGRHLLKMVDDVLNLSRIEAGTMEITLDKFALKPMAEELSTLIEPLAEQNHNRFELIYDEHIQKMYADGMRIRQVLYNLLSNACKFTHEGMITLEIQRHMDSQEAPWVCFKVKDTGIGIGSVEKEKLFQLFTQVDISSTREYGGTGLGLVISRRFCQLMGGTITVESELGKGSTFIAWLPQYVPAEYLRTPPHDSTSISVPLAVLEATKDT